LPEPNPAWALTGGDSSLILVFGASSTPILLDLAGGIGEKDTEGEKSTDEEKGVERGWRA
jgi:hypothetical protein